MKTFQILLIGTALPSYISASTIQRRATGDTATDPFRIIVDCTNTQQVCNADCYNILCFNGPNPVHYEANSGTAGRQDSGAARGPLRDNQETRERHGIQIDDATLDITGRSPEDAVMASSEEGGEGDVLYATITRQNTDLGTIIGGQLRAAGVTDGKWYHKTFTNTAGFDGGPDYCAILQNDPTDQSQCPAKGKKKTDPSRTAFMRALKRGARNMIMYHMMDFAAGDRWTGKAWNRYKRDLSDVQAEDEEST